MRIDGSVAVFLLIDKISRLSFGEGLLRGEMQQKYPYPKRVTDL